MRLCVECGKTKQFNAFELMGSGERRNVCVGCVREIYTHWRHRLRAEYGFEDWDDWDVPASRVPEPKIAVSFENYWQRRVFARMETPYVRWLMATCRELKAKHARRLHGRRAYWTTDEGEKQRERRRERYKRNRSKEREYMRRYREEKGEQILENQRIWRERNKEHQRAYRREYYLKNRERELANNAERRRRNRAQEPE